ncbi:MAG: hypothetical protein WCH20_06805 [Nitrospira sp.]
MPSPGQFTHATLAILEPIKKVPLRLICKRAAQFRYFGPFSPKHRHPIMHI